MEYQEDRTTCLAICGDSSTPGQEIRIVITVRWESDLSVSEEQMKNAAKSYEPARMLTEETLEKYGAEGCRISYQLGNDDMGSWSWNDVLTENSPYTVQNLRKDVLSGSSLIFIREMKS